MIVSIVSTCKIYKTYSPEDTYPNGQKKFEGEYIKCLSSDTTFPSQPVFIKEQRKVGTWISYYPNGLIKEIRHYTETNDCQEVVRKQGDWIKYTMSGEVFSSKTYRNDTLILFNRPIYQGEELIEIENAIEKESSLLSDTYKKYTAGRRGKMYLPNPRFDLFYFTPALYEYDGFQEIHEVIPYWKSRRNKKATVDYYNCFRSIQGIDNQSGNNSDGLVGLMLYLNKEAPVTNFKESLNAKEDQSMDYSEDVSTLLAKPLEKDSNYCLKLKLRLSDYSGYRLDTVHAILSVDTIENSKQVLSIPIANISLDWSVACVPFQSQKSFDRLAIGKIDKASDYHEMSNYKKTDRLSLNNSAYYLLEEVSLKDGHAECICSQYLESPLLQENTTYILQDLNFEFNSTRLINNQSDQLEELANYLKKHPLATIIITGHTDETGSIAYNEELSSKRAEEVKFLLVSKGLSPDRIITRGKGKSEPISETPAENRRVEFEISSN